MDTVYTTTITKKFQVHIPKEVRDKIGITKAGPAKIQVKDDAIVITPTRSPYLDLIGSLAGIKPKKPIDLDNLRDYIDYSDL